MVIGYQKHPKLNLEILGDSDMLQKLLSSDKGKDMINNLIKRCQENKSIILELIKDTEI
jgi:hypothetical protein